VARASKGAKIVAPWGSKVCTRRPEELNLQKVTLYQIHRFAIGPMTVGTLRAGK
jgi:hypothetical protein